MNLIAVDVGNTRISCGSFRNGILVETWHHKTEECEAAASTIFEKAAGAGVALSSVVPSSAATINQHLSARGQAPLLIGPNSHPVISGLYETIGADRLANATAAWKLYAGELPAIALDLGTATTLTAVSPEGRFCGGLITLGLGRTLASLHAQAAQLPDVKVGNEEGQAPALAFDTTSAISLGTILAHVGGIENWVKAARKILGGSAVVVATGGWSALVSKHTSSFDFVDPHLTLKGIYLIAELAAGPMGRD